MTQDIIGGVIIFQNTNIVAEREEKRILKIGTVSLVA